jgi:hypothetical protein
MIRTFPLFLLFFLIAGAAFAQAPVPSPMPVAAAPKVSSPGAVRDAELVERLIASRKEYQVSLEALRTHYISSGDLERAKWAEDELISYHRVGKNAFLLELDVPPPSLKGTVNIPEANELYRRAITYKDKGWGTDFVDNQRRAEILFQMILGNHATSNKISDTAYQLGDLYEGKNYKQFRRAAAYYERSFQWNPLTQNDGRIKAARLYDKMSIDRNRAIELYKEVIQHDTDPQRLQEAQRRLAELGGK